MLKLCHFPGIKIQNNLSYNIVGLFVSCILTVCLSHWALSEEVDSQGLFLGERNRFLVVLRHDIALFAVPRQYPQSVIWAWTLSSDFSAFCLSKLQFLRLFSCSCWYSKSVLAEGIKCIWWSRMKCMWIKYIPLCMHSMWVSIWDCVCWYVSLVIKQLKKKKAVCIVSFGTPALGNGSQPESTEAGPRLSEEYQMLKLDVAPSSL